MIPRDQDLSVFVLRTLHVTGAVGMRAEDLLVRARTNAWRTLTAPELDSELQKLADESRIVRFVPAFGSDRWRITAIGTSLLQEAGLA